LLDLRERQLSLGKNAVLVSRSTALQNTVERILAKKNDVRPAVVSLSALTFSLALVPGCHMSLKSLREALFGSAFVRNMPPLKGLKQLALKSVNDEAVEIMDEPQLTDSVDDALGASGL
jgi:hypothetical protein